MARKGKKSAGNASYKRLQTTVRADDPTVILGGALTPNQTVRNPGTPYLGKVGLRTRLAGSVSRVAQRISPKVVAPVPLNGGFAYDRKAHKRLRKIAKQMARQAPRKPRSKLPLFIALILGLLTGVGYYTYQAIPWQSISNVAGEYLDYNDWLAKAAGQKKPSTTAVITRVERPGDTAKVAKSAEPQKVQKRVVKRVIKKRVLVGTKSSKGKTVSSKSTKSSYANKQAVRRPQQGLATLQKKSASNYKRASYKSRQR